MDSTRADSICKSNLINNALLVGHRLGFTAKDTVLCCSPISHCFGLVCGILAAIVCGGTVVLPSDVFVAEASLRALTEDKCTVVHAVPTMFQAILDHPEVTKHAPHVCLRTGIIAGSSLSRTLLARLEEVFGFTGLAYGYGMTELSCIVFLTDPTQVSLARAHTSVGTVMPVTAARVVDENMNILPPGRPGELVVSGYLIFQGYYKNQEKTAEALIKDSEGRTWLRTGDLVTIDASGRCTITGRMKDMIKRGECSRETALTLQANAAVQYQGVKMSSQETLNQCWSHIPISRPALLSVFLTLIGAR
jgi:acyl-CoA synthetase (AMP-forming)/AMP-acid ligase II